MATNEIPAPHIYESPQVRDKEIISSMVGLRQYGGTFAVDDTAGPDNDGFLPSGTVVARDGNGYFVEYADTVADPAVGVLRHSLDVSGTVQRFGGSGIPGEQMGNVITAGELKLDQLVGLDAGAIADLNGRTDTPRNTFTF